MLHTFGEVAEIRIIGGGDDVDARGRQVRTGRHNGIDPR
jgi:hypothetical protein